MKTFFNMARLGVWVWFYNPEWYGMALVIVTILIIPCAGVLGGCDWVKIVKIQLYC